MPREQNVGINKKKIHPKVRKKTYILAYEDNYASPEYFEELTNTLLYDKNSRIRMISLKRRKGDTKSAPKHVFQKLKKYKAEYLTEPNDEFWMIIDRDQWQLEEWLEKCQTESNFYVALSNPCFEFWLFLHLFNLAAFDHEELLKNRKLGRKRRFLDHYLSQNLEQGYNKTNIIPERFVTLQGIQSAIDQARALDQGDIMHTLGSHNYKLIERLLND